MWTQEQLIHYPLLSSGFGADKCHTITTVLGYIEHCWSSDCEHHCGWIIICNDYLCTANRAAAGLMLSMHHVQSNTHHCFTSHCAYVRPAQGDIVVIAAVFCCAQLRYDVCVCVCVWERERERERARERETGRFSSVEEKTELDFKGVSGQRSTSQAQMPALWGHVNFMPSNYLSRDLVISLASCICTIFTV